MVHISVLLQKWKKKRLPLLIAAFFVFLVFTPPSAFAYDACSLTSPQVPCTVNSRDLDTYIGSTVDAWFGTPKIVFYRSDCAHVGSEVNNNPDIYDVVVNDGICQSQGSIWDGAFQDSSSVFKTGVGFQWVGSGAPHIQPENDTIGNPQDGDHKPVGEYTFSGQCTTPGLHYALNWRDFNYPATPTITCQEDYTWSATYIIQESGGGGRPYYLYNYETEQETVISVIGYKPDSLEWFVGLDYPQLNENGFAKVIADDEFPIRIKYTVPEVDRTKTSILMQKFSDSTFTTATATEINNTLSLLDELKAGFFDENLNIAAGTQYYQISIIDDNTQTVQYSQKIRIEGTTNTNDSTAQLSVLPDKKDLGFWGNLFRDMFVPRPGFMNLQFEGMRQVAETHFPIYFQLSDIVQGSTTQNAVVTIGTLHIGGETTAPMTFFNPAAWNPDTFAGLRSFLSMLMYVWLMYFVIHKVSKIFSS